MGYRWTGLDRLDGPAAGGADDRRTEGSGPCADWEGAVPSEGGPGSVGECGRGPRTLPERPSRCQHPPVHFGLALGVASASVAFSTCDCTCDSPVKDRDRHLPRSAGSPLRIAILRQKSSEMSKPLTDPLFCLALQMSHVCSAISTWKRTRGSWGGGGGGRAGRLRPGAEDFADNIHCGWGGGHPPPPPPPL